MATAGSIHGDDTGGPYTIAIEHAINMLLARVAFDLLRSPKFKLQIIAHIQKKLDELKVPDYINALQVNSQLIACTPKLLVFSTDVRDPSSECVSSKLKAWNTLFR